MTELAHASEHAQEHHAHHWEMSWAPIAIAFGVFFLVPMTFSAALIYHYPLLAILTAGVGVPLIVAGVARWIYEGATQVGVIQNVSPVGIGVFIIGEILIFFGLFVSYWVLRLGTGAAWPPARTTESPSAVPLAQSLLMRG